MLIIPWLVNCMLYLILNIFSAIALVIVSMSVGSLSALALAFAVLIKAGLYNFPLTMERFYDHTPKQRYNREKNDGWLNCCSIFQGSSHTFGWQSIQYMCIFETSQQKSRLIFKKRKQLLSGIYSNKTQNIL